MDEPGFRSFLKRRGKKEHVVDGLVRQVKGFEEYLAGEQLGGLEAVGAPDLEAYLEACEAAEAGSARVRLRGLALYFGFAGQPEMASLVSGMREQRISAKRKAFLLRDFRGANPDDVAKLEIVGISNADQMLAAGRTSADREALAHRTGVALEVILEFVKLSDLARMAGVKAIRARLYLDGGFDTLDKIAAVDPEAMRLALAALVEGTGFDGIPPLPKEARNTVAAARALPRLVEY